MAHGRQMLIDGVKGLAFIPHRFFFDEAAYDHLEWVFKEIRDDGIKTVAAWAKPPYETLYFEVDRPGQPIGVLVEGDIWSFILAADGQPLHLRPRFHFPTAEFSDSKPIDEEGREALTTLAIVAVTAMAILAQPTTHKLSRVDARSGISRGKRVVYRAHSTVSINLAETQGHFRQFLNGHRGSYRRHEVRGTWVHFHKVSGCQHEFVPREVAEPDPMRPRYICSKCGQYRSWRPSHERGDAGKGWVEKDYRVTHHG